MVESDLFQHSPPWFQSDEPILTCGFYIRMGCSSTSLYNILRARFGSEDLPCVRQGIYCQLVVPSILHAVSSNNLRSIFGYGVAL